MSDEPVLTLLRNDAAGDLPLLLHGWMKHCRLKNLSPETIRTYRQHIELMARWYGPVRIDQFDEASLKRYVEHLQDTVAPATVAMRFRSIQQFCKWLVAEEELEVSPIARIPRPFVPEVPVPVVPDTQIQVLLSSISGRTFEERRDIAIIRLFLDCGIRLSELAKLTVASVDMSSDQVVVMGKGRRVRTVPFDAKTSQALMRYLRERAKHPHAGAEALWVGTKGPLTNSGIAQMLKRRSRTAVTHIHPHQLRHTSAHLYAAAGMSETNMMRIFGWKSDQMPKRYGASAAHDRAMDAKRRLGVGNTF